VQKEVVVDKSEGDDETMSSSSFYSFQTSLLLLSISSLKLRTPVKGENSFSLIGFPCYSGSFTVILITVSTDYFVMILIF
jgi:uncharacterized protein (DUF952 family)